MASLFSATQLVAAWVVVSRRPLAWRLGVLIVGMLVLFTILQDRSLAGPSDASTLVMLLSLGMLKIALVLAICSVFSSITIVALWAALSPARPAQRAIALALVLCVSTMMLWPGLSGWYGAVSVLLILLLATHALIVLKAARVWRMWETAAASSNRATAGPIDS